MTVRVAINGFGRIGRTVTHAALDRIDVEIVAINDLADPGLLAHLFQYDSVHGRRAERITLDGDTLMIGERCIRVLRQQDPADLPWADLDIDVVVESTGVFTDGTQAAGHLVAGARRVLIAAPATNEDLTVVIGVNTNAYNGTQKVISTASCTTNCAALLAKVLHDNFGIRRGLMNTAHAYTSDQRIQDMPHKDYRRARAAAANIIPTTTGAARAIGKVLPSLAGRLDGLAMRVPVIDGSVVDLTVELNCTASTEEINHTFSKASQSELAGLLTYTEDPIVSSDIVGTTASCIFDAQLTMVVDQPNTPSIVKVLGWYDNEYGFSNRTLDLVELVGVSQCPW